jgi:hypothetical protein
MDTLQDPCGRGITLRPALGLHSELAVRMASSCGRYGAKVKNTFLLESSTGSLCEEIRDENGQGIPAELDTVPHRRPLLPEPFGELAVRTACCCGVCFQACGKYPRGDCWTGNQLSGKRQRKRGGQPRELLICPRRLSVFLRSALGTRRTYGVLDLQTLQVHFFDCDNADLVAANNAACRFFDKPSILIRVPSSDRRTLHPSTSVYLGLRPLPSSFFFLLARSLRTLFSKSSAGSLALSCSCFSTYTT